MSDIHVHLLRAPEPEHLDYLRAQLNGNIHVTTGDDVPDHLHVLVGGRPKREHIAANPHLSALIFPFAGLPAETRELMREFSHITVHNLHHNAATTAETALALMMAAAKLVVPFDRALRQDDWTPRYEHNPVFVFGGKTALILGYGAIGQQIGAVCRALGMDVLGVRRRVDAADDHVYPVERLSDLLPRAHVLMVCVPGTPETEGMIGETELRLMPEGSLLVNVGRGMVIDQGALYRALRDRHLFGAGIDVWYNYPQDEDARKNTPPADYPFGELDNVVLSPHRGGAGGTHEVELRRMAALAESLNAFARGDAIPNRVDLDAGY